MNIENIPESNIYKDRHRPDPNTVPHVIFFGHAFTAEEGWKLHPEHEDTLNRYLSSGVPFKTTWLVGEKQPFIGFCVERDEQNGSLYIEGNLFMDYKRNQEIYRYMDHLERRPQKSNEAYVLLSRGVIAAGVAPGNLVIQSIIRNNVSCTEDIEQMFQEISVRLWKLFMDDFSPYFHEQLYLYELEQQNHKGKRRGDVERSKKR